MIGSVSAAAMRPVGPDDPVAARKREWVTVTLLTLGFGLVGLDRFIVVPLAPAMMEDLGIDYAQVAAISSVLALTWAISSVSAGALADRFGRKVILVWSMLLLSILSLISGLIGGIVQLLIVRGLIGMAEGAFTPASITATLEASHPTRRGRNLGLQQMGIPLFGLALGPVIATQLLAILPNWRWVLIASAIPGFFLAVILHFSFRETLVATPGEQNSPPMMTTLRELLSIPLVRRAAAGMAILVSCLAILSVILPLYLINSLGLGFGSMGFVMSAIGAGGIVGQLVVPWLFDRLGARPVLVAGYSLGALAVVALLQCGASPVLLFACLFSVMFFVFGLMCLTVGPLTANAVPPVQAASATGVVVAVGEFVGGAIVPLVAGFIAQRVALATALYPVIVALVAGAILSLQLTARPAAVRTRQK